MISRIEPQSVFRFLVQVDGIPYGVFTECTLPSLSLETLPVKEGGQNNYTHKLPVRTEVGTITMKRGIVPASGMLKWYLQAMEGKMNLATRQVNIVVYNSLRIPINLWSLRDAYPTKWSGPSLNAGDSAIAIESLELVFHDFEVE